MKSPKENIYCISNASCHRDITNHYLPIETVLYLMDYLYENLGDERFQEFCTTLLSKEFPNTQAYPVGQPDGGRDFIVYNTVTVGKPFIVFQVKFVVNANQERDVHNWLTKIIEGECEKVNKLIQRGAIGYYLLTNVRGTAHLDSGSKDKVNKILEENIKVPSVCWWRDDLSRLFEKDPLFKWSYPEVISGQDVLNSLLFENLQEHRNRRENVIRAYLTDQFEIDNEVKFKQIELQNKLFALFTDVPVRIKKFDQKNVALLNSLNLLAGEKKYVLPNEREKETNFVGAAELFLHPAVQNNIQRILLEGGPGQGKSTISQYICQVHRVRLLNNHADINLIPKDLKKTPVRLPIKVDLRDVASWVERKNPWKEILSQEYFESIWKNSLEAFLVGHIFYHSNLEEFNSTDFIAVCKLSPILFVFDGFDEIANIKVRSEVIDFINKGIVRISVNAKSLQIIITSRPAAFTDYVGFSTDSYPHFELKDITPNIINDYVGKWIKARKLEKRDADDLRRLINNKLELPHLKDLAKSPMQLAIFINLLRTKGQSLPNKRTALYDSYIELFFDREAEKNELIYQKRDLIIDIHQYLAWVLHSEAELYKTNGSIDLNDLTIRLKEYLNKEGHDTNIADQLFNVMKERVCALVSRVQGTFEFEVQPLREYFCAKYLYKSAPHSSAGSIKEGTKPDRFSAILRSFYWQNVVRFFAGCADAGELDMLIQELKDLHKDDLLKYTTYPRTITSLILSDYVFSQKPLKLKNIVELIVEGISINNVINQKLRTSSEPILLPIECGRIDLLKSCWDQLLKFPTTDYATELLGVISNNAYNNLETWLKFSNSLTGSKLTKWLSYAFSLNLINEISEADLLKILKESDSFEINERLEIIILSGRITILEKNNWLKQTILAGILNNNFLFLTLKYEGYSLGFISRVFQKYLILRIHTTNTNTPFIEMLKINPSLQMSNNDTFKNFTEFPVADEIDEKISNFSKSIQSIYSVPAKKLQNNLEYWDNLIEAARNHFGDCWTISIIATLAAGIKSKDQNFETFNDLNNSAVSLCKRVRCARMKSGNANYWNQQLKNPTGISFTLLILFSWATPRTIFKVLPIVTNMIKSLKKDELKKIVSGVESVSGLSFLTKDQINFIKVEAESNKLSDEVKVLLGIRISGYTEGKFLYENINKTEGIFQRIVDMKFDYLISAFLDHPNTTQFLKEIKLLYPKAKNYQNRYYYGYHISGERTIPYEVAKFIITNCEDYPEVITSLAEKSCRLYANQNAKPVGEVAKNDKWFN